MSGLLDFLQGASNSAASNVSAPIDGINWLLRKSGLPVSEKPFLGSDWMAQRGLTQQPQNKLAGLLGESVGGVAPMLAAAKAPQIANGLLQMVENAAFPQTLSRQAGMIKFPDSMSRPEKVNAIRKYAEDFAASARSKGLLADIEHSGSKAGPSSYVSVSDPITQSRFDNPFRFSDHSKGAKNYQFVNEVDGDFTNGLNLQKIQESIDEMAAKVSPAERMSISFANKVDYLRRLAQEQKDSVFTKGRPLVFNANKEARDSGADFSKAFSNSGNPVR